LEAFKTDILQDFKKLMTDEFDKIATPREQTPIPRETMTPKAPLAKIPTMKMALIKSSNEGIALHGLDSAIAK
jgi:hypothetical protein